MILYLIEHPGREMHIAKKLSKGIADIFSDEVVLVPINFISFEIFRYTNVRLIIAPSVNKVINILQSVTGSPVLFLNYEQMLSEINRQLKKIDLVQGPFDKYVAWSDEYRHYLVEQGISNQLILQTDRPQFEIAADECYVPEKMKYFLSRIPGYDESRRLVFIPITCLQAFKSDNELKRLAQNKTVDYSHLRERKSYVKSTLHLYYKYLSNQCDNITYIVRPHPSITADMHQQFVRRMGLTLPNNVVITTEFSPYQWIARCNLLITNYSSLALDATYLGRSTVLVNAPDMPEFMRYDWFDDYSEFTDFNSSIRQICTDRYSNSFKPLSYHTEAILNEFSANSENYQITYSPAFTSCIPQAHMFRLIANLFRRTKFFFTKSRSGVLEDYFEKIVIKCKNA